MNYFICKHNKVFYQEVHFFDPTFYPVDEWKSYRDIQFKCIPMTWTTKWLRVIFVAPSNNIEISNRETHQWVIDKVKHEYGSYLVTDKGYVLQ